MITLTESEWYEIKKHYRPDTDFVKTIEERNSIENKVKKCLLSGGKRRDGKPVNYIEAINMLYKYYRGERDYTSHNTFGLKECKSKVDEIWSEIK